MYQLAPRRRLLAGAAAAAAVAAAAAIHELWYRIRVAVICKLFHRHLLLKWECFKGLLNTLSDKKTHSVNVTA